MTVCSDFGPLLAQVFAERHALLLSSMSVFPYSVIPTIFIALDRTPVKGLWMVDP